MKATDGFSKVINTHKMVALGSISGMIIVTLVCAVFMKINADSTAEKAFFVDRDGAGVGMLTNYDNKANRFFEVKHHVKIFSKLMFELDENNYFDNLERAQFLAGRPWKELYASYASEDNKFYRSMRTSSTKTKIVIDSMSVNVDNEPYRCVFYARYLVTTPTTEIERLHWFDIDLEDVTRTEENPHGLTITRYDMIRNDQIR